MRRSPLSRRAVSLSPALPAAHFPSELHEPVISFDSGFAFPGILPDLTAAAGVALNRHRAESLQYSGRRGLAPLRQWIAGYMSERSSEVNPDDLMIVNGAKHGIDLICRLLVDEGDAIVVTAPTYFTGIPIFRSFGVKFIEVSQDAEGLNVDELERTLAARAKAGEPLPKFIYDMPDFHNPSSVTMSLRRRMALLQLAARHGIHVVEDSPYRHVRFEGEAIPSLRTLDRENLVIHVGTFSKLIAPGLRIGWVSAQQELLARMMQLKSDGGSSALLQRTVVEFCQSGAFDEHAAKVRRVYGTHRDTMVAALRTEWPEISFGVPEGGYYIWLTLPERVNGDQLAARAADAGVNIIAGSRFFAIPRDEAQRYVRLTYSHNAPDAIEQGIVRLARVCRSLKT